MMPWHHEFFRETRSASDAKQTSANFRLWVGMIGYCVVNSLCWGVIWGNYLATYFLGIIWGVALPVVVAVALLVLKVKSQKVDFTWGAYAAAVITLAVVGWVNLALVQAMIGAV